MFCTVVCCICILLAGDYVKAEEESVQHMLEEIRDEFHFDISMVMKECNVKLEKVSLKF